MDWCRKDRSAMAYQDHLYLPKLYLS